MCPSAVASRACCLCCCAPQDGTALSDGFNTVALASDGSSVLTGDIYIFSLVYRQYTGQSIRLGCQQKYPGSVLERFSIVPWKVGRCHVLRQVFSVTSSTPEPRNNYHDLRGNNRHVESHKQDFSLID